MLPQRAVLYLLLLVCLSLGGCDAIFRSTLWMNRAQERIGDGLLGVIFLLAWPIATVCTAIVMSEFRGWTIVARLLAGALVTLPIAIVLVWWSLGVPPWSGWVFSFIYVSVGLVVIVGAFCIYSWHANHPGVLRGLVATFICFTMVAAFFAIPPVWAIARTKWASNSMVMEPLHAMTDCKSKDQPFLFAHVSDLHITVGTKKTRDGGNSGNVRLAPMLRTIQSLEPSWVVLSGDLTDTGEAEQWNQLDRIMAGTTTRMFTAPGNHDLNRYFGAEPHPVEMTEEDAASGGPRGLTRLGRLAQFQAMHGGKTTMSSGKSLVEFLGDLPTKENLHTKYASVVDACKNLCRALTFGQPGGGTANQGCQFGCSRNWMSARKAELSKLEDSFPWVAHDGANRISLIALHSVSTSTSTVGQNAVGFLDDAQLERTKVALGTLPLSTRILVVTLHHPLFIPPASTPDVSLSDFLEPIPTARRLYLSDWFMSIFLENNVVQARKLLDMLQAVAAGREKIEVFVLYGHRHKRSLSRIGDVVLVEAPNVGTEEPADAGIFAVSRESTGLHGVRWCELTTSAN